MKMDLRNENKRKRKKKKSKEKLLPVATREFVELAAAREDAERNLDVAENRELSSLLD